VSSELRRSLPWTVLFALGLALGVWIFAAPWIVGYPMRHGWTSSVLVSVWLGVGLALVSSLSLVVVVAHAVSVTLRARRPEE
jgi:hypothetical protein